MSKNIQLVKKILIKGEIETLSGLLIGGANTAMGIGGPDKMVIRNPVNNEPYVPGSTLKGKMRSLLEISFGVYKKVSMGKVEYGPSDNPDHITTVLFGSANGTENQRPSRIIFRDGRLLNGADFMNLTDLPFTETKTEVVIDRVTSAAMPRTFERVPAGAKFELEIVLNIFESETRSEQELLTLTLKGLQMIEDDYIGGSGSRGSGRVKFRVKSIIGRGMNFYHKSEGEAEEDLNAKIPPTMSYL